MAMPTGSVEMKSVGTTIWVSLNEIREVHTGDALRTSVNGTVAIQWGERGVTRVESNSEIEISKMPDPSDTRQTVTELNVVRGSIWSRLLKLLSVESAFTVTSQNVVATIRGTAFGFAVTSTVSDVAVTDSVVLLTGRATKTGTYLREGRWGRFDANGPKIIQNLPVENTWWKDNTKLDERSDAEARARIRSRFDSMTNSFVPVVRWAMTYLRGNTVDRTPERRMWMAHQAIADLALTGESVRFNWILSDPNKISATDRDALLADIRDAKFLLANDSSPSMHSASKLLSDIRSSLASTDPNLLSYVETTEIEEAIDALIGERRANPTADFQSQIKDLQRRIDEKIREQTSRPAIIEKLQALYARLEFDAKDLNPGGALFLGFSALLRNGKMTSTGQPIAVDAGSTICLVSQISISASNLRPRIGEPVTLSAKGLCPNAQSIVLTSQTQFSSGLLSDGTMVKNIFTTKKSGPIDVYGVFLQNRKPLNAKLTLDVLATPVVQKVVRSVRVSSVSGASSVVVSGSLALKADATWSDGSVSDVTPQCQWSVSDPLVGFMSGRTFFPSKLGDDVATCTYLDVTNRFTGSFAIHITL